MIILKANSYDPVTRGIIGEDRKYDDYEFVRCIRENGFGSDVIAERDRYKKAAELAVNKGAEYVKKFWTAQDLIDDLVEALRGVIAVADRKTDEFDRARAVLERAAS